MEHHDNLELPLTTEITRELFNGYSNLDNGQKFNVDNFLLDNNFQFISLDTLSRQLSDLTKDISNCLIQEITTNFDTHRILCKKFNNKEASNELLHSLQEVKYNLKKFDGNVLEFTNTSIQSTKEVVCDTLDYLKSLDDLNVILNNHNHLNDILQLGSKLCTSLHDMIMLEIDDDICHDILLELYKLIIKIHGLLTSLNHISSSLLNRFRNEYQSLLEQFYKIIDFLVDKFLVEMNKYPNSSSLLISIMKSVND